MRLKHAKKITIYTYDSFISEWGPGPIIEKIFEEKLDHKNFSQKWFLNNFEIFDICLFPFAILYGLILWVRNGLFNIDLFKVSRFPISTIGIGNLSLGGTGKSIVVDYLLSKYHSMKSKADIFNTVCHKKSPLLIL